jgi:hypothetical protein
MLKRNRGFVLIAGILVLIGLVAFKLLSGQKITKGKVLTPAQISHEWSEGKCKGSGTVPLTASPIALEDLGSIAPMGNMVGNHVTPSDHLGFAPKDPAVATPIRAMADGFVVKLEFTHEPSKDWYGLLIEHSCSFYSNQYLLSDLAEPFKSVLKKQDRANVRMPVKAGQVIGSLKDHGMDYWLANLDTTNNFINPSRYTNELWKTHVVDPFDYYAEPLKSQLLAKNLRQATPRGGVINYDKPGTLSGNWFKVGAHMDDDAAKNAVNELTFGHDYLDPTLLFFSTGDYQGQAKQSALGKHDPDPATVVVASGPFKYSMVSWSYRLPDGTEWDRMHAAVGLAGYVHDTISDTVLVELVTKNQLKVEIFPNKMPSEVNGFTSSAMLYER